MYDVFIPQPLSSAQGEAWAFYSAMKEAPLDTALRFIFSDWEDDHALCSGEIRRGVEALRVRLAQVGGFFPRPDQLEYLRGVTLTEEECRRFARALQGLLCARQERCGSVQARGVEQQLSALLGPPQRADEVLDPLDPENVRSQYDFQRTLLASLDLLESRDDELGISDIHGHFYSLPSLNTIQSRLTSPELRCKVKQGFNQLTLVPFALPLPRLIQAWRSCLVRNKYLLQGLCIPDVVDPLNVWTMYHREDIIYFPRRFEKNHGGKTKAELLASDTSAGWQALLTKDELHRKPGRRIREPDLPQANPTPRQLGSYPRGEIGWTPETYIISFVQTLERTGCPLDANGLSYLAGAYYLRQDGIPRAFLNPWCRRMQLDWIHPIFGHEYYGARTAVILSEKECVVPL